MSPVHRIAAVGALALIAVYRELLQYEYQTGNEVDQWFFAPSDTSPLIVVGIAVWLAWRRRQRMVFDAEAPGRALAWPLFALALLVFGWARATGAADLEAPSLAALALGLGAHLGGLPMLRAVWLPSAVLVFALPLPAPFLAHLVWSFQLWTAEYAGWLLYVLGLTAMVSGDLIFRVNETFQVIEGCSGLRSVETLSMLTVLMIDLFNRRGAQAAILLLLAPFVAFAINGLRVLTLILNPASKIAAIHTFQGIVVLMCGLIFLYVVDGLLERLFGERGTHGPPPGTRGSFGALPRPVLAQAYGVLGALLVLSLAVPPFPSRPEPRQVLGKHIPESFDGWESRRVKLDIRFLERVRFRDHVSRRYDRGSVGRPIDLFVAVADHAMRNRSVFSPKTAVPGSGWSLVEERDFALDQDRSVPLRLLRSGTRSVVVLHWYEHAGGIASESLRSFLALDHSPLARPRNALVIRLSTELGGLEEEDFKLAERRLQRFYRSLRRALDDYDAEVSGA